MAVDVLTCPATGTVINRPRQPPVTVHHVLHHVRICFICIHACSAYCTTDSAKRRSSHLFTVKLSDDHHELLQVASIQPFRLPVALLRNPYPQRSVQCQQTTETRFRNWQGGERFPKLRSCTIPAKFASACAKLQSVNGTSAWHTTLAPVLSFQRDILPR